MKRILFVDDEPKILGGLRRSLRSLRGEWDMVFAEGGAAALEQCASGAFDVVVSDARMPGMEGPVLLRNVMELYPDTTRFILSGQCNRAAAHECVAVAHQFLSKPCEPELLTSSVRRVCTMREEFADQSIRTAISRTQWLPSQSRHCRELADAIASPEASIRDLAAIIAGDIGMTTKVVQLVSSGFFGAPQHVASAAEAAMFLGLDTIRELFMSSAGSRQPLERRQDEDLQALTDHSLAVAAAAGRIMETLTDDRTMIGDASLAGFLHEVGTLALNGCASGVPAAADVRLAPSQTRHPPGAPGDSADGGLDPGGYLAALWGLPYSVVQAIAYHRVPSACVEKGRSPLTALHVANAILENAADRTGKSNARLAVDYLEEAGCRNLMSAWRDICESCRPEGVLQ